VDAVAALATRNTEFYGERVFDADAIRAMRPSLQPMAWPWLRVHELARTRGLRLTTADQVGDDARGVLLIAYDWTPDAERLVAGGARPAVLVSFEPPVIAWSLYAELPRLSERFSDVFLFEGARDRVHNSRFHALAFPRPCPPVRYAPAHWAERRFLAMVNSNKVLARASDLGRWLDRPREVSLKRELAALRYRPIANDRYPVRLAAILALADVPDFDLYGEGWERRHAGVRPAQHARALRVYRGSIKDKLSVLAGYRFALAIENTRFAGYVSEKLLDCLVAGTIPIYDGAPDVARYVPSEAFIELRAFAGYAELERHLRGLSEVAAQRYLDAGRAFLGSPAFERFCAETFARDVVDALQGQ
jgi:hypothetical protein